MDTDSFSHFYPPPSSLITCQNPKKKRSKMIKINDNLISPSTSSSSKPKKPDPKITRPCTECGKKFWSWKALFGHMRCHPERQWRGINPPPNFRRSRVSETMTDQDIEIATCLILLANGRSNATETITHDVAKPNCREVEELETAVEVCRDVECSGSSSSCRFECSSCKKVFGSHQALGGHRASHKNVKGCFAMAAAAAENVGMAAAVVHECSVCLKVFSSGQALGGHMRCHWEEKEECFNGFLDLNLPPMDHMQHSSSSFSSGLILDLRLGL